MKPYLLLRGGFGVYEYDEPVKLIWTNFSQSCRTLGQPLVDKLTEIIMEHKHIEFTTTDEPQLLTQTSKDWWANRRKKYNKGLVLAGITAFICYAILGSYLIAPYDNEFEITLFTIFFQGVGYLIMMAIANLFYNLGYWADKNFNKDNSEKFRQRLFSFGFWLSCGLPFLIPVLTIVIYLVEYKK